MEIIGIRIYCNSGNNIVPKLFKNYKKFRKANDLLEFIARVILIPSGVILIITWFVG